MKSLFSFVVIGALMLSLFSCKTLKMADAEGKQKIGEYYDAAQIYRHLYRKTPPKERNLRGLIAFRMAECNRLINSTPRAYVAYRNALRYAYPDSVLFLRLGQMAQKSGKYGDAITYYSSYLENHPKDRLALQGIKGCQLAAEWKDHPTRYTVKKMDLFNSRRSEMSPMLYGDNYDQLYFSSTRESKNKNKPVNQETDKTEEEDLTPSGITGLLTNDFFLVKQNEKGKWLPPIRIDDSANTKFDEGTPSFSADGNKMYYTYCSKDETGSRTAEIYVSSRSSASWSKGSRVPIVKDSVTALAHPSISPDGKWLYFVSNAIGGYGGKDLFRCKVSGNSYGPMENLGTDINTPGDEVFPYARDSVTLYFASNGHPGMGGLDLYKATQVSPDHWKVENLKAPINSNSDDFGITFEGKKEKGFFTSNRRDAKGYDHLYSFELPVITIRIEGIVYDVDEEPIAGATVRVVGRDGLNAKAHTLRDGDYGLELERNINYVMMASAKGFLNQNFELTTAPEEKSETYFVDFYLSPINRPVVIDHIYYDFDKATLRPESKEALDKMVKTLHDNPNITIELRAHTDRKGSDAYNIRLAQRRAQSVVDYLIKSGISKNRLEAKGYGKRMPKVCTKKLAKNYNFLKEKDVLTEEFILKLPPEQQEIADQLNRRTEFKVIRTNYNLF